MTSLLCDAAAPLNLQDESTESGSRGSCQRWLNTTEAQCRIDDCLTNLLRCADNAEAVAILKEQVEESSRVIRSLQAHILSAERDERFGASGGSGSSAAASGEGRWSRLKTAWEMKVSAQIYITYYANIRAHTPGR